MKARPPLPMRISFNAPEHLGIDLYINVPAVLFEIVANSWDADAQRVKVTIDKQNNVTHITRPVGTRPSASLTSSCRVRTQARHS
jgi:hypothetical protein